MNDYGETIISNYTKILVPLGEMESYTFPPNKKLDYKK